MNLNRPNCSVVNGRSIRLLLTAQITPETCPSLTSGTAISVWIGTAELMKSLTRGSVDGSGR